MRVIVLGLGSMGASTASHLARQGVDVLGFDQLDPPHQLGSHHGESRMIRQAYYEHPDYVPLLLRAYELWKELEQRSGKGLLTETGGLYLAPIDSDIVAGSLRSSQKHQLSHQILDHSSLQTQYPQFQVPSDYVGFFEKRAGFLRPEAAISAYLAEARKEGATLKIHAPIESWETSTTGVQVKSAGQIYHADHLVITAGSWVKHCLQDLGTPLTITRQLSAWFEPLKNFESFSTKNFPSWFIETDAPYGYYGFPANENGSMKLALHKPGEEVDPNQVPPVTAEEREEFRNILRDYLPDAAGKQITFHTCLYTNSPDGHFIVGNHPSHQNVTIATGFSGHGFKFASVMGEALADLALAKNTSLPIDFLKPTRFV